MDSRFSLNFIAKCLKTKFKTRIYYKTIVSGFILHTFDNFGLRFFFWVVLLLLSFHLLLKYHISRIEVFNQLSLIVLYNTSTHHFDNEYIVRKGCKRGIWKLAITHSDLNSSINISHFKQNILAAVDNLKVISQKYPDVDSIFDFIVRTTVSNITKDALAYIIADLIKQHIIINK